MSRQGTWSEVFAWMASRLVGLVVLAAILKWSLEVLEIL